MHEKLKTFKIQEKMKTIYNRIFMLAVALMMSLVSFAADACIDGISYNLDRATRKASVTYNGNHRLESSSDPGQYVGAITIPSFITHEGVTYKVTTIGNYAFCWCKNLTSITIPNSVTSIGTEAFGYCESLTSIIIPNSVTNIGDIAFRGCEGLTSIIIPNSVTNIGDVAFSGCEGLTSIKIPDSVTEMGFSVFSECTNLSSVSLGSGLKEIPHSSFYNCDALKSISIPDNIINIGDMAFQLCDNLKTIEFPNTLETIGDQAFYQCASITSLSIPNSVTFIGRRAFSECTELSFVSISNKLDCINSCTFDGCAKLASVIIPSSVTKIDDGAFGGCPNLSSVINLSSIPQNLFWVLTDYSTYGDLHVPVGCKEAYQNAKEWNYFNVIDDAEEVAALTIEGLINAIGTVKNTADCKSKITTARFAFDSLSKEVQALVKNANLLIEAEKTYEKLSGDSTGIININTDNSTKSKKYLENGKIVIVKNGKKFNINGLNE